MLTDNEKNTLIAIARQTLEEYLSKGATPDLPNLTDTLKEIRGAFVTLTKKSRLAGCIGNIVGRSPLAETVQSMAIAAATQDPRFQNVKYEELSDIHIEISVLSPIDKISPDDVIVGTHGLIISKGPYQGVLLPQVPLEYGWDRKTFLEQTCMKAGLEPNAWQEDDAELFGFTAEVFSEKQTSDR